MKNEALQEAVSMIDDKYVEEAQKPFQKRRTAPTALKICLAAAACAAAVCAVVFIPHGKAADILVSGKNPSESPVAVRSYDNEVGVIRAFAVEYVDIPVSITSSEKSVVEISDGTLHVEGDKENVFNADFELELFGNASLVWTVPLGDASTEYELTVQTGNHSRVLALSYDESEKKWTVREKSVN